MAERSDRQTLGRATCLRLLASSTLGRVVITVDTLPAIHPVTFAMVGGYVLFRTTDGAKFDRATRGDIVTFQADNLERQGEEAWTVTIVGRAEVVTDADELSQLPESRLPTWATAPQTCHLIRIQMALVYGYRTGGSAPRRT